MQQKNELKYKDGRDFPEFLPLPSQGEICPLSGCTRSFLNSLILPNAENNYKPPVKSLTIRKRGRLRGKRLIVTDSLFEFLLDHLDRGGKAHG